MRVDPRLFVLAQRQRHYGLDQKAAKDQRAASELGRLNLRDLISTAQYEAGLQFVAIVDRYRAVIDVAKPFPNSASLEQTIRGESRDISPEEAIRRREKYMQSFEALSQAGRSATMAVKQVAVLDRPIDDTASLESLRAGLTALARHFGLEDRRR